MKRGGGGVLEVRIFYNLFISEHTQVTPGLLMLQHYLYNYNICTSMLLQNCKYSMDCDWSAVSLCRFDSFVGYSDHAGLLYIPSTQ